MDRDVCNVIDWPGIVFHTRVYISTDGLCWQALLRWLCHVQYLNIEMFYVHPHSSCDGGDFCSSPSRRAVTPDS
jgi:hypothetical protein